MKKTLIAIFTIGFGGLLFANEDHLIMIPTPIFDRGDGGQIYIVNRPMISGYGADFEGKCGRIAAPYLGEVRSPSSKETEADMNPASVAKVSLSALHTELSRFVEERKQKIDKQQAGAGEPPTRSEFEWR